MDIYKLKNMVKGWFVGDFEPSAFKTKDFEVCYRIHPAGEEWDHHYHKEAVEINLLISGKMTMLDQTLSSGDVFVVNPYEIADPVFIEDCAIVCVKTPSVIGDKYIINEIDDDEEGV
jgi:mannose-6-phosphate isomerase-like protein (cupin superfamily)